MIIAPSEGPELKALASRVSNAPERLGVDILFASRAGVVGIQRKQYPGDFLSSVADGRLAREVSQMRPLRVKVLVLEGRGQWSIDGTLLGTWGQPWTLDQQRGFLWSMRQAGVWVDWTDGIDDTVKLVQAMVKWAAKVKHQSLMNRPNAKGGWGKADDREWAAHFLQGFDGIGPEVAGRIYDRFGRLPLTWTCSADELARVHGMGPKRVGKLMKALPKVCPGVDSDEDEVA